MAKQTKGRKIYKSMRGKTVDLDILRKKNELTPAVGNARVNARGDELGPGGKIVRKREDIVKEHYRKGSRMQDEIGSAPKKATPEETITITEELTEAEKELLDEIEDEEWIEDEDGNFVKKGD